MGIMGMKTFVERAYIRKKRKNISLIYLNISIKL